jgi:molybdopterin-guanine dinucleotide biosynthesis protein A
MSLLSLPRSARSAGIVLCGGKSSRMGRPKALLPFGPELMLQRVVRILSEVVSPIVVVAAPGQERPPLSDDVLLVRDEHEGRGPLEGLSAGMKELARRRYASDLAIYATSCDVPLLAPEFIRQVLAALGPHQTAVPVEARFFHPLAAAYRLTVLPEIETLLAGDQLRPAYLFDRVSTCRIPVETLRTADPELHSLKNCNRPEDYLAALRIAGFEAPPTV